MDNFEKNIIEFAKRRDDLASKKAREKEEHDEILKLTIKDWGTDIERFLKYANLCRNNNIDVSSFMSSGIKHNIGFNRELEFMGFYNGGACGDIDFWVNPDGNIMEWNGKSYDLEKFVKNFEEFYYRFEQFLSDLGGKEA